MPEETSEKRPIVSVVMSTHNRADSFLSRAIESVINQAFPDWELLVVDDCSTDNTRDVVQKYAVEDSRIKYHVLDRNFGNDTHPKNIGIKASKGEFICFLDDDNAYRPDHIAALYHTLHKNPGLTFVYGDRYVHPSEQMVKEGMKPGIGIYSDYDPFILMTKNYIDTSDVMIRKDTLMEVGGFDESIRKFIDWNLWVRLAKTGKLFQRVAFILTDYYIHDEMKSSYNKEGSYNPDTGLFTPTFDPLSCKINSGCLGPVPKPRIAFFSLVMNRLSYTKIALQSILDTVKIPIAKWVFVDNASTDGTVEYLCSFATEHNIPYNVVAGEGNPKLPTINPVDKKKNKTPFKSITIIMNTENVGIAFGSNQAVDSIDPRTVDYVCKSDNDAEYLTQGWLEAMMDIYSRNNMMVLSPYIEGLVGMPGAMPRAAYGTLGDEYLGMVSHIGGICSMAPSKVYWNWRWPQAAFKQGGNDVLFSSYVQKLGYQLAYLENHRVNHIHGTIGQERDFPEYYAAKTQLRRERYTPKENA